MEWIEPDWEDMDRRANMIVARYSAVSAAFNILPMPFDVMGVTATFAKMATELAGVYQVNVSSARAQKIGWAISTTTASVLGLTYAGSKIASSLVKWIPGAGWIASVALQAPLIGAVAWAAGDALKDYFKQTRRGTEPTLSSFRDSFASMLHLKLKGQKIKPPADASPAAGKNGGTTVAPEEPARVNDAVEMIAGLHELLRAGAITQEEFDAKKTDLLKRM